MINTYSTEGNISGLNRINFQKVIDGKSTDLFILNSSSGSEVAVTNYGCAILSIMVPDKNGKYANVVLGHDSIDHVINSPEGYLNTVIGRYGNRIAKGKFVLEGKEHTLAINNGPNALHGGPKGFHTKVWDVAEQSESSILFTYTSPDGEEGFPGNLTIRMRYSWTNINGKDELRIEYSAQTDQATLVNLTNHGFFNLAGTANPTPSTENHTLTIFADFYVPIDDVSIPTGEIRCVEGTPMDFRTPHLIGERIDDPFQQLVYGAGYDHTFVLNKKETGAFCAAALCEDKNSGRVMEVHTTEPGVQLYTGNWLNGFTGAHGATYPARSGVCFEAQRFPDSPNKPHFPTAVLSPGEEYRQITAYSFYARQEK